MIPVASATTAAATTIADRTASTGIQAANADELNSVFKTAAESAHWQGILQYTEDPIVSSDIVGSSYSCIIDGLSTMAHGKQVKVIGWYDNEWGYSCRLVDLIPKLV